MNLQLATGITESCPDPRVVNTQYNAVRIEDVHGREIISWDGLPITYIWRAYRDYNIFDTYLYGRVIGCYMLDGTPIIVTLTSVYTHTVRVYSVRALPRILMAFRVNGASNVWVTDTHIKIRYNDYELCALRLIDIVNGSPDYIKRMCVRDDFRIFTNTISYGGLNSVTIPIDLATGKDIHIDILPSATYTGRTSACAFSYVCTEFIPCDKYIKIGNNTYINKLDDKHGFPAYALPVVILPYVDPVSWCGRMHDTVIFTQN